MPDQAPRRARDVERELVAGMQKLGAGPRRLWEELANRVAEGDGFVVMSMAELAQALGAPESSLRRWRDHLVGRGMIAVDWALGPNGGRSRRDSSAFIRMLPVGRWCGLPGSNRKRPHAPALSIVGDADPQRTLDLDPLGQTSLKVAPDLAPDLAPDMAPPSQGASGANQGKDYPRAAAGDPQNNSPQGLGLGDLRSKKSKIQESSYKPSNRLRRSTVGLQKDLHEVRKIGEAFPTLQADPMAASPIPVPERALEGILNTVPLRGSSWLWVAHRLVDLMTVGDEEGRLLEPRVVQGLLRRFAARKHQTKLGPVNDPGPFFQAMAEEAVHKEGLQWRRPETDKKPKPR